MNASVEMLNRWGDNFLSFAWPMLWQSSLLIIIVFAFDFLTVKKIRASVRYALWMVVLIKLVLPPALALPTSATWWLWRPTPTIETPIAQNYSVTIDETAVPENFIPRTTSIQVPPPELTGAAWIMLAFIIVALGLLFWLAFRWLRIARKVYHVATSVNFTEILETTRQLAGLRRPMRLRLIDSTLSPAVYGLFRPVILLPLALTEKLSRKQLRAVLLHEAIHLRRGDVWVNCAQTFLQIAYWWHPLLWLANVRIRRVREEAVDDAVMTALNTDADAYAPTLLEVAKFAFRRPLASLGLVGIMESRSALRQRIERLVDFRPPSKAGLTLLSLFGIFAFSAVALPMGQGPAPTGDSFSAGVDSGEKTLTMTVNPEVFIRNLKAQVKWANEYTNNDGRISNADWVLLDPDINEILLSLLKSEGMDCVPPHYIAFNTKTGEITTQNTPGQLEIFQHVVEQLNRADGKCWFPLLPESFHRKAVLIEAQFFWINSEDLKNLTLDATWHRKRSGNPAHWTADAAQFNQIEGRIKKLGLDPFSRPGIQTADGITGEMYVGTGANWIRLNCNPYIHDNGITLAFKAEKASVSTRNALLITNLCEVYGKETVDDNGGIIVRAESANDSPTNLVVVLNVKGVEEVPTAKNNPATPIKEEVHDLRQENAAQSEVTSDLVSQQNKNVLVPASKAHIVGGLSNALPDGEKFAGPGREAINKKLNHIRMDIVSYQNLPLSEVIRNLHEQTQLRSSDKAGINFLFNPNEDNPSQPVDDTRINITLRLNKVALPDLLNAICLVADHPIKYSVEDYGVVFSAKDTNSPQYEMRSFKVDPKTFNSNLQKVLSPLHENDIEHAIPGPMAAASIDGSMNGLYYAATTNQVRNVNTLAQQLFSALNVNLPPPETVFFNDRLGVLFAYATPQDLKVIEHIVEELNDPRFKTSWLKIGKAPAPSENSTPVALSEIISDPTTKVDPDDLVKRTFPVDFNGFNIAVRQKTGEEPIDGFKQLAAEAGVDLSPPKTVFLDSHVLFVYAPKEDMAALQKVVDDLHCPPPQIHLKARFIEVPPSFFADFSRKYNIPTSTTNGTVVLTNPNFQVLLHEAQLQQGVEEVAEPEVTMTAGRQVEMRATIIQPVITNFVYGEAAASSTAPIESNKIFSDGSSAIVPEVAQVETGPILDATPVILYGDEKIYLQTTASQIDFLGYGDPKKLSPHYATNNIGQKVTLPIAVPLFQVREAKSHAVLYDGQTMVLFPEQEETVIKRTGFSVTNEISPQFIAAPTRKVEKKSDKTLLVLVTATLMDSAGNRIHSDDQIPIAKDTDYFDPIP